MWVVETVMTRPTLETNVGTDLNSSLEQRCKIANNSNCDYFISIHCNSYTDNSASGTETLIIGTGGKAELLAKSVQKNIVDNLDTKKQRRKIIQWQSFKVLICLLYWLKPLSYQTRKMPSCLLTIPQILQWLYFWGICELFRH